MTDIVLDVKAGVNLVLGQILAYAAITEENIFEFRAFLPDLHGRGLNNFVSSITGETLFHQFQQDALGINKPTCLGEIGDHVLWIHQEAPR